MNPQFIASIVMSIALVVVLLPASPLSAGDDYHQVIEPRTWAFPRDHGRHDGFKTEWWYFTGNVTENKTGRPFGYQITFFRSQLVPPAKVDSAKLLQAQTKAKAKSAASHWRTSQFYLGHMHVSDLTGKRYFYNKIRSRGRVGMAYADKSLNLQLLDWHVGTISQDPLTLKIFGKSHDKKHPIDMDLTLIQRKPITFQGKGGISLKGKVPGQASYYYSMTRLETKGTFTIGTGKDAEVFQVAGNSWMDHEFSSKHLSKDQSGWDWFSIQLENGTEWMVYRLRDLKAGTSHAFASHVDKDGGVTYFKTEDLTFEGRRPWKSPHTGARYPQQWTVTVQGKDKKTVLDVKSRMPDQEMVDTNSDPDSAIHYYEGSIEVTAREGETKTQSVNGVGYLEMTGYARPLGGDF